jgi:hypothetical protein
VDDQRKSLVLCTSIFLNDLLFWYYDLCGQERLYLNWPVWEALWEPLLGKHPPQNFEIALGQIHHLLITIDHGDKHHFNFNLLLFLSQIIVTSKSPQDTR